MITNTKYIVNILKIIAYLNKKNISDNTIFVNLINNNKKDFMRI